MFCFCNCLKDFLLFFGGVAVVKVKAVHVGSANEIVQMRGVPVEMQTCYIADQTAPIKLQLWETQVGALETGKSLHYINNVSTREFGGDLYLTATRSTEMKEVAASCCPGLHLPFTVDEGDVTTVTAQINGNQVSVRRSCVKCYAWQADLDAKANLHRYMRCGLLQKIGSFQPITA